jgi:hypothetical protein
VRFHIASIFTTSPPKILSKWNLVIIALSWLRAMSTLAPTKYRVPANHGRAPVETVRLLVGLRRLQETSGHLERLLKSESQNGPARPRFSCHMQKYSFGAVRVTVS